MGIETRHLSMYFVKVLCNVSTKVYQTTAPLQRNQISNFSSGKGKLFILPNLLSDEPGTKYKNYFPSSVEEAIQSLNGLIAGKKHQHQQYQKAKQKEKNTSLVFHLL